MTIVSRGATRPNVIIVLLDDVGYGDLTCHGNPIVKTPNINRLHSQSVRLTDFHVAPMCTPTRSQLLSGRDALDNGAMNVSSGRSMMRSAITRTLADVFADGGYRTGLFGKWHLGDCYPHRPQDKGFDKAMWFPSSHIPSAPDHWNNDYFDPHLRLEDGSVKQFKGYCTDIFFDEAMQWIEKGASDKPFFAYIPLNSAHGPLFVPDKYREPYRSLPKPLASFYAMIANIDENIGRLEAMLERSKLRDDTIVIFFSDNGGTVGVKRFNAGLRDGKVTLWDGGHRAPCFIRWPNGKLVPPCDVDELAQVQDIFPTLIDFCGLKTPADANFDGVTLAKLVSGDEKSLADRMLVVQFSRMDRPVPAKGDAAVLWKKWRLVNDRELYDVSKDPAQQHDVAAVNPQIVQRMREHYEKWWADVSPTMNDLADITLGADAEPETLLSAADWQDVFLDQQRQVRDGVSRSGAWGVHVVQDGDYTFELRRWPREADAPLSASMPKFKAIDGEYPPGNALPIAKAKIRVGETEKRIDLTPADKSAKFVIPLQSGRTKVQTWFYDASGQKLCGAYYVYVKR
jgi:arylsulfatase